MNKTIIFAITAVVIVAGIYLVSQGGSEQALNPTGSPTPEVSNNISPSATPKVSGTVTPTASPTSTPLVTVKTFVVVGKPFSFAPAQITVNKGDTVKIVFQNVSGTHDWKIDEFNAQTKIIQGGQEETIQFVADKTGTFEYYCSVGTHRQMGMKGTLTVK